jgi:hypothetical protein
VTGKSGVQTRVGTVTAFLPGTKDTTFDLPAGLVGETANRFRFESSLLSASATPGNVLDWFEVEYQRRYVARDDVLIFTNGGTAGEVEYQVSGFSASDLEVFDVTDVTGPVRIELGPGQIVQDGPAYTLAFRDSVAGARTYVALSASRTLKTGTGQVALRPPPLTRDVSADYVVVSHPNFTLDIEPLLAARRAQGHTVFVASPEEVYDDFGNGMKSDAAIKRFIKQAYLAGDAQFVLLVGDANLDHRGVLLGLPYPGPQLPSGVDYVPTHSIVRIDGLVFNKETRPSDNWFVTVDSDTDLYPDLYIGRLPVGSAAEVQGAVAKIITFEADEGSDPWKKRFLVVADDEYKFITSPSDPDCYSGSDTEFMWSSDSLAYIAGNLAVAAPDTVKYYLAACLKDDQPEKRCGQGCCTTTSTTRAFTRANCTPDLLSLLGEGALIVNYQGHSNRYEFTHEQLIRDDQSYSDIRGLRNADRPFVFIGLGCWMSDFQVRTEPASFIQDAIGEKFLLNPDGAACASFASACSEYIGANADFNIILTRTIFTHLVGVDPQGRPIPARILMGEAVTNALIRNGKSDYAARYLLFGDPAMVIDMGPPAGSATVDGVPVGQDYAFWGETFDTLDVALEIRDEEAIMEISLDMVEGGVTTPVPAGDYSIEPLVDLGFERSRAYGINWRHVPHLGDYALRLAGKDYSGKTGIFDIRFRTGSAAFFKDEAELPEGGTLVLGQTLRVLLTRPFAFTEGDVAAALDGRAASEFPGYALVKQDADGKVWEMSLVPSLQGGQHTFTVSVSGFAAERSFRFMPARVEISADGRNLYENDFVAGDATLEIKVTTESGTSGQDLGVNLDGAPYPVLFEPDTSQTEWTGVIALGPVGLLPGGHELAVTVHGFGTARNFRISEGLGLLDVSVFPNPFSGDTYFFYTLTGEAREARLSIYTVSGRKVFVADAGAFPGYNQYRWDGRDERGDRVANGTYIYKLVVRGGGLEREAVGRIVKLD